jgi:type II secretion system protein G
MKTLDMKPESKAKFRPNLNQKNQDKGFTLIELLVVLSIIGILAAVALPSLLSQSQKAKQVEARNTIGALNRAQQAYNLDKGGFAKLEDIGLGVKSQTSNYEYRVVGYGSDSTGVANIAKTLTPNLKPYTGLVWAEADAATSQSTTRAILCEEPQPKATPGDPSVVAPAKDCGPM